MAWFKVDDKLHSSKKLLKIPRRHRLAAIGLWTVAGSWAADQVTDGNVPDYMIPEWGGTENLVQQLVAAGLWTPSFDGHGFSNWSEYQPMKADIEAGREKNAAKLRKWRESNHGTNHDVTGLQGGYEPVSNPAPDPTRPDPTLTTSNEVVKERAAKRGSRLSPDWLPSAESVEKARKQAPSIDHKAEHEVFIDYWTAIPGAKGLKLTWDGTWLNWMRRKEGDLKGRPTRSSKPTPTERATATLGLATDIDMREIEQ